MRYFLMLAAAASLAACHNRSEDEVGAAPAKGDTTTVQTADTTQATVPTDTTTTAVPAPTSTDSTGAYGDSTSAAPADSTAAPNQ